MNDLFDWQECTQRVVEQEGKKESICDIFYDCSLKKSTMDFEEGQHFHKIKIYPVTGLIDFTVTHKLQSEPIQSYKLTYLSRK
jgi:hypothetical protein